MKKHFTLPVAALVMTMSLAACSNKTADELPANTASLGTEVSVITETSVSEQDLAYDETSDNSSSSAETGDDAKENSESRESADAKESTQANLDLADGTYLVDFDTDSTMFHVNESMKGKAVLTVTDGKGTVHLVMPSKNVLNLYKGLVADVEEHEADWIRPTVETVTYDDGMEEEVYAFDVPVDLIGEEFDLALIGKKAVWYDHKVSISNPEIVAGEKTIEVSLEGGTGKVKLISPTIIKEEADGYLVTLEWSSKNYDYMIVDGVKYFPVLVNEHSIFEIPVKDINASLNVIADTVAMSTPHEIEYVITFSVDTMK